MTGYEILSLAPSRFKCKSVYEPKRPILAIMKSMVQVKFAPVFTCGNVRNTYNFLSTKLWAHVNFCFTLHNPDNCFAVDFVVGTGYLLESTASTKNPQWSGSVLHNLATYDNAARSSLMASI